MRKGRYYMDRRDFIKNATLSAAYSACGSAVFAKGAAKKDDRPNILFIITDKQNAGMMSCTGNKWLLRRRLWTLWRRRALLSMDGKH